MNRMESLQETALDGDATQQTGSLAGRIAVVTGASGGIGRAIAVALSRQGARVCALGRNPVALAETVTAASRYSHTVGFQGDLTAEEDLQAPLRYLQEIGSLDVLVHCAGIIHLGMMEQAHVQDLDRQYFTNVRMPYVLTQCLLPLLIAARGQVAFVNSSAGLSANRPEIGQYAATKHALKALADSLRQEVNPKGIRVLTAYIGRTATPMQEALFREEGRTYDPEALMQPEDVASIIVHALLLPPTVEVTDISMRPMRKS